jgi:hypothetical protein
MDMRWTAHGDRKEVVGLKWKNLGGQKLYPKVLDVSLEILTAPKQLP